MITQEFLKSILDYDPQTGDFIWKVKLNQRIRVGDVAGALTSFGYIVIRIKGKGYMAHRLAWFYVYGVWPTKFLDHEDQIKHHNWVSNLREATKSQNGQNVGKRKNNTSGHKGVNYHKATKKWCAQITAQGKRIHLGLFAAAEEASEAYKQAQSIYHTHRPQI